MFGAFPTLANLPSHNKIDPKDIPPPTPVTLPRYQPFAHDDTPVEHSEALSNLLKQTGRPNGEMGSLGLSAIGFDLSLDSSLDDLIPDKSYVPDFREWSQLSQEDAREKNEGTRRPLRNGNLSPGCQVYLERLRELSHSNKDAFRTVRRIPPPKGQQQARLGNAYEFFRCLELFTSFWDDPTHPLELPPSPEMSAAEANSDGTRPEVDESQPIFRTCAGHEMPTTYRESLLTAFIKLVAYDFGCNANPPRVEGRLHMSSPVGQDGLRKSYWVSRCHFISQSAQTRETARAGLIYGPLAAVSARSVVDFTRPDMETAQSTDLAREIVAVLVAAQNRARENRTETRYGAGKWWTFERRWGGGTGGPIGREIEQDAIVGDKDDAASSANVTPPPSAKRQRKTMTAYDSYRMVRPASSCWDKKTRYEAIGRQSGADYDDVFLVSSLFHHVSVMRVRVPLRLLEVLGGSPEEDLSKRSWGKVQAWRSPWYDFFDIEERSEGMRAIWAMMAYQMRKDTGQGQEDVSMPDA